MIALNRRMKAIVRTLGLFGLTSLSVSLAADPQLASWFTANSGRYARIYQSIAAETARTASTTWSRGQGVQTNPTYAGVSEVSYSATYVYIRTTGLGSHLMGPWFLDAAKTQNFPNFPSNTARIVRIPRTPVIPASGGTTGLGASGYMVNGVALFDMRDAFSYSSANATDATPVNGVTGDGIWNRDAYHNESITFDAALAHQAGNQYHYHAQPVALRHQLGDHVDYNEATNRYTESAAAPTRHSPIIAWAWDGLPIYGPYGYASRLDATSGGRRMISGYRIRDGQNGTANLAVIGRTTLPVWAATLQGRSAVLASNQYGPNVNATYALGHYLEDYDYLGDLGFTQHVDFDLDETNARYCVTPEFPGGTWAYFTTIAADGTPMYPYNTGRRYKGSATGGQVTSITETVVTYFQGGPNKQEVMDAPAVDGADVTLSWQAVEGATYTALASSDLSSWTALTPDVIAGTDEAAATETGAAGNHSRRFYKVTRKSLATFDATGFNYSPSGGGGTTSVAPGGSASRGTTVTVTITLPTTPPLPPANVVPQSITLAGSIAGTAISRPSQATAQATFAIPANAATGAQNIVVVFNPGPTYTLTGGFTIN